MSETTYRPVPDHPGYRAGTDGGVQSCWNHAGVQTQIWLPLKQRLRRGSPYYRVCLKTAGLPHGKMFRTHLLVLAAFHGPRPAKMVARHLNGNPLDNRPDNLCWGTQKQNGEDTVRHGRSAAGEKNWSARLTSQKVREMRAMYKAGATRKEVASKYGMSRSHTNAVLRGKFWDDGTGEGPTAATRCYACGGHGVDVKPLTGATNGSGRHL